jgi:hypothetical protein
MDNIDATVSGLRSGIDAITQEIAGTFPARGILPTGDQNP